MAVEFRPLGKGTFLCAGELKLLHTADERIDKPRFLNSQLHHPLRAIHLHQSGENCEYTVSSVMTIAGTTSDGA